jgi:2-(1,2-epoxy-1,2-dihydrophenyl)acetyl-CoA isomerase
MTADGFVQLTDDGPVRTLTLTNPHRKNAVPSDEWEVLAEAFSGFERSPQRVLIVTGSGNDFCAGADLNPSAMPRGGTVPSAAENLATMAAPGDAATVLHRLSKPTIAAVDGVAVGAGMNLALGCDIIVASDRARFSEIFVQRGLTLDFGGTWLLPRLVGLAKARELALTGRIVEAAEALQIGLVALVVPPDVLRETAGNLATELAAGAPLAQRFIKVGLDRSTTMTFEQAIQFEDQAQAVLLASQDFAEGVRAFLAKETPRFEGR